MCLKSIYQSLIPYTSRTKIKHLVLRIVFLNQISKMPLWKLKFLQPGTYCRDGVITIHEVPVLRNQRLKKSLEKSMIGIKEYEVYVSSSPMQRSHEDEYEVLWRIHIAAWAAQMSLLAEGDFVECGTRYGLFAKTISDYTKFEDTGRHYYLLDTWNNEFIGLKSRHENSQMYEFVRNRFADSPHFKLVRGLIPDSLKYLPSDIKIAFLSIDLNDGEPELHVLNSLFDKLSPGGYIYLDDYSWGYPKLRANVDSFFEDKPGELLTFHNGVALYVKQ